MSTSGHKLRSHVHHSCDSLFDSDYSIALSSNRKRYIRAYGLVRAFPLCAVVFGSLVAFACSTLPVTVQVPGASVQSPSQADTTRAFVCDEVSIVHPHFGKVAPDGVTSTLTPADVSAVLMDRNWRDELSHLVGDTDDTIYRVTKNDYGIRALCGDPTAKPVTK